MKVGDIVVMNDKYYVSEKNRGKKFRIIKGPQYIGGWPCVWLEGHSGCYAMDGLDKVGEDNG